MEGVDDIDKFIQGQVAKRTVERNDYATRNVDNFERW